MGQLRRLGLALPRGNRLHPSEAARRSAQYCYVRALDEMERLTSVTLYTYSTAQLPQTSDEILDDMLDFADVDTGRRQLETGTTLVPAVFSPPIWGVVATDEIHPPSGRGGRVRLR